MKFHNPFIKETLLISSLVLYFSCVEPFPELPPETQIGAGTFGCLVNNELVFAKSGPNWWGIGAGASYIDSIKQLQISTGCQFGQQFIFLINNPYERQDTLIDTVRYLPPNSTDGMEATRTGNLRITRIGSLSNGYKIVSGNFFFDLNEPGKTPIHVTKGRFDLTFYTY